MQPDDVPQCIQRNFRNCELDVHPSEKALVVRYDLEAVVLGDGPAIEQSRACQKVIRVKSLNAATDLAALAREIVAKCDLLHESQTAQVERLLLYLQQRRDAGTRPQTAVQRVDGPSPPGGGGRGGAVAPVASMACLESYVEMLYEEGEEKVRGSSLVLQLARSPDNLGELAANDTLLCALARVLREDGRRDTQLATNLAYVFFCLSTFSQFHPVIAEYKAEMARLPTIERLAPLLSRPPLTSAVLRLLLNLSFERAHRSAMLTAGLIPKLVQHLVTEGRPAADETPTLCVLYHLSLDDRCKSQFPYTDCVPWLVQCLLGSSSPQPAPLALAISLAGHRRNAQLFASSLEKLLERALRDADALFLRLVRTATQHGSSAHSTSLASRAEALCNALMQQSSSAESDFALECASTLAQLEGAHFEPLLDRLLPWIRSRLVEGPEELLVPLVQLVATVARSGETCAHAIVQQGLVADLTDLLRARQEDDQLVLQVAYAFDALVSCGGGGVRESLVREGGQEVPAYLLDLLPDRNPEVGRVCGHALALLAHHFPEWERRLRETRFCWHNAQWLAVVQSGEAPEEHEEGTCEQFLDRSDLLSNGSATSDP
ncbi:kinesin associated protein 3 isoform X3 [Haemaphysalis longicornis]